MNDYATFYTLQQLCKLQKRIDNNENVSIEEVKTIIDEIFKRWDADNK